MLFNIEGWLVDDGVVMVKCFTKWKGRHHKQPKGKIAILICYSRKRFLRFSETWTVFNIQKACLHLLRILKCNDFKWNVYWYTLNRWTSKNACLLACLFISWIIQFTLDLKVHFTFHFCLYEVYLCLLNRALFVPSRKCRQKFMPRENKKWRLNVKAFLLFPSLSLRKWLPVVLISRLPAK